MPDKNTLTWTVNAAGITFSVPTPDGFLPVREWAREVCFHRDGTRANIAPLAAAIDRALDADAQAVSAEIAHAEIEHLLGTELKQIGLPRSADLRLRIRSSGLIASPEFKLNYDLTKADGTPVIVARRSGSIIQVARNESTLLYPLYSLIEGIERLNSAPAQQHEKMLRWADLKPLLPDNAEVGGMLQSINVVRADAFTLETDAKGQITPVLRYRRPDNSRDGEDDIAARDESQDALPADPHQNFAARFSRNDQVRGQYALSGNWYVVLSDAVQRGLQVVKHYQNAPTAQRLAFIGNPKRFLQQELDDVLSDEVIEHLFEETPAFLSQRIECLGVWQPKNFSYSLPSACSWFPGESEPGVVLALEDRIIPIAASDVEDVRTRMQHSLDKGESKIQYGEHEIPVSEESLSRMDQAIVGLDQRHLEKTDRPENTTETEPATANEQGSGNDKPPTLVPLIADNLESVGYAHRPHQNRGEPGGLPASLKTTTLYPHQKDGLIWLQEHWAYGSNGALLADDMGLGKTVQTLAFLAWIQEQSDGLRMPHRPFLIVAPTGLLKNWEKEADIHLSGAGLGRLVRAYGPSLKEIQDSASERRREFQRADWVMTTYETLRDKIHCFVDIHWRVVAYDEVQKIKNPLARIHEMAKSVEADFYLALTGTPVENRIADLWAVIDTIAPGQLGSLKDFERYYEKARSDGGEINARLNALRQSLFEHPLPARIMRRMKEDHLSGLPTLKVEKIQKPMPAAQADAYRTVIQSAQAGKGKQGKVLEALQHLRRISLLAPTCGDEGLTDTDITNSARLQALVEVLDAVYKAGEKVLVFLEYRDIQDQLISYIQQRYSLPEPPMRINGQTTGTRRQNIVDTFQGRDLNTFDVLLLSPKAAGVGLTLTSANHVVHLSRWWNPAVEDQCTDRVFRIGQTRSVTVHLPIAIHPDFPDSSFDINLDGLLERKRTMSRDLLAPADVESSELEDLLTSTTS